MNRRAGDPALSPEEVFGLYGDLPPAPPMSLTELDETLARLAEFDTLFAAA